MLILLISNLPEMDYYRNLILKSSSFPRSLAKFGKGVTEVERRDWLLYRTLFKTWPNEIRKPIYGDYAIVNPSYKIKVDPRILKPPSKIIYTTSESWVICKGGSYRESPKQMFDHSDIVVSDPILNSWEVNSRMEIVLFKIVRQDYADQEI